MMAKSNMNQDILKVLLSEEQLHQRIQEMGDELFEKFRDKDPMFVGVLNGCFVFCHINGGVWHGFYSCNGY